MGKFSDFAKKRGFLPLELNEDNVNTIYKRCIPTETTKTIVNNYLFLQKNGFPENSRPFHFDLEKLQKEYKNILYLLGQLKDTHENDQHLYLNNFSLNYLNIPWFETLNSDEATQLIFNLIALGTTVRDEEGLSPITPLIRETEACLNINVLPTLSPKDPKFDEWSKSEEGKKLLLRFNGKAGEER